MPPTIISRKASNWVDRGEPPDAALRRVLAYFFERNDPTYEPWLEEQANTIVGMVAEELAEFERDGSS